MQAYQHQFIELALQYQVLQFGHFTLKSGITSPYFFNLGQINDGYALQQLGKCYAAAIFQQQCQFDVLFGPAYKGIPLAATTAIALNQYHHLNKPYAYNRKEAKDHGEKGTIIGHPLTGNILLIDDTITAGTTIVETLKLIDSTQAHLREIVIAFDRQEKADGNSTVVARLAAQHHCHITSIITRADLIDYLSVTPQYHAQYQILKEYAQRT